jgi:hypothetical protein
LETNIMEQISYLLCLLHSRPAGARGRIPIKSIMPLPLLGSVAAGHRTIWFLLFLPSISRLYELLLLFVARTPSAAAAAAAVDYAKQLRNSASFLSSLSGCGLAAAVQQQQQQHHHHQHQQQQQGNNSFIGGGRDRERDDSSCASPPQPPSAASIAVAALSSAGGGGGRGEGGERTARTEDEDTEEVES